MSSIGMPAPLVEMGSAIPGFVEDMSVDDEQDVIAEVGGQEHAAAADLDAVEWVLGHETHPQEVDRFRDRANAVPPDVLGGDDRGGRRRVLRELVGLGGAADDLLVEKACQILVIVRVRRARRREYAQDDGEAGKRLPSGVAISHPR